MSDDDGISTKRDCLALIEAWRHLSASEDRAAEKTDESTMNNNDVIGNKMRSLLQNEHCEDWLLQMLRIAGSK